MIAFSLAQKGLVVLREPDSAYPALVRDIMPIGVKGLVVGGLLSALMSSLASLFNSSAVLFTVDFYKKFKPLASEKHLVFVGRTATTAIVLLGILWIPVMRGIGGVLFVYLQSVQALLAPGIAAVFVMGVFWKRTSSAAGMAGLTVGFAIGMFRLILDVLKTHLSEGSILYYIQSINWLYFCIYLFLLCILVVALTSLITTKPHPKQLLGLVYGLATEEQRNETRQSWNIWDVVHSAVIIGVIVAFYCYFW
jgi:SSS family solute:Na+ symporter